MKTIWVAACLFAVSLGYGAEPRTAARTNAAPASTNLIRLNAHQQFYRAIEMQRSRLRASRAQLEDAKQRLQRVIDIKGVKNAKGERAEQKKYIAALDQVGVADKALDLQVAQYELRFADAKQWANWWVRTNAARAPRRR